VVAEIQDKLKGQLPSYESAKTLMYMEAALLETLRLHPSVPIDLKYPRKDDQLPSGVIVPAGMSHDNERDLNCHGGCDGESQNLARVLHSRTAMTPIHTRLFRTRTDCRLYRRLLPLRHGARSHIVEGPSAL